MLDLCCKIALALHRDLHVVLAYDVDELATWAAYFAENGYPDPVLENAKLLTMLFNVNRGKGSRAKQPSDFLPKKRKKAMTSHQITNHMMSLVALSGGQPQKLQQD